MPASSEAWLRSLRLEFGIWNLGFGIWDWLGPTGKAPEQGGLHDILPIVAFVPHKRTGTDQSDHGRGNSAHWWLTAMQARRSDYFYFEPTAPPPIRSVFTCLFRPDR